MKRYHDFIKKTAIDNEYREDCNKKADYFKFWNTQTSKHNHWSSPQYYENRVQKERAVEDRERKRLHIIIRRQRLAELFRNEALVHNAELRQLQEEGVDNIEKLRTRHQELRERLDAENKAEAELQLYHQWRRDDPAVREAESNSHKEFVREAWAEQLSARRIEEAATRETEARQNEEARLDALRKTLEEEDAARARREEEKRLARLNLEEAKEKLRENQLLAESLHKEEAIAARMEQELFKLEQERLETEQARKKHSLRSGLERQAVFRLRHRAVEVQRELEQDRVLLERVQRASEQAALIQSEQRHAREELAKTLRTMAQQAHQEAGLARHNANLFHEEAVRELGVLEQRWQRERDSRHKLLVDVLTERQTQARDMRERASQQRQQLQHESKELTRLTEHLCHAKELQAEADAQEKQAYRQQLDLQVAEKEKAAQAEKQRLLQEETDRKKHMLEEAARLDAELKKITFGPRRKAWL